MYQWGYTPVLAQNGEEAWQILSGESPPRMVLLDWTMPRMEGPEVCARIRGSDNGAFTYVVFLTAKSGEAALKEAIESGADDFITKPVKQIDLQFRLEKGRRVVELYDQLASAKQEINSLKQSLEV